MCRDLVVGQIHHQRDENHKLLKIYTIVAVHDGTAVCTATDGAGKSLPGRFMLPDNPMCRYASGPLPEVTMPLEGHDAS